MRLVHAIGYAAAAAFAATIGVSFSSNMEIPALGIVAACAALGAFVGWNRTTKGGGK